MDAVLLVCLQNCDLSQAQIQALREEGYLSMDDFTLNHYQDIDDMAKQVQVLSVARGGMRFGQVEGFSILAEG